MSQKILAVTSTDEKFLTRVLEVVEKNVSNENFSAEDFAENVGMSKTHLNRKLNALTDTSANEFIRTYRLKKAARLLSGRSGNISEIAYEVGFSNPSYFAESFKKLFGYSPSEFFKIKVFQPQRYPELTRNNVTVIPAEAGIYFYLNGFPLPPTAGRFVGMTSENKIECHTEPVEV